ncbi:MAG: hypothetical protein K1X28_09835 [Parachlamydiales bacterium]|nr:hypothetical protein [Parachlamydiales bacterium]
MKMIYFLLFALMGYADELILVNQTAHPAKNQSKMAVQWASSGKEVDESNSASLQGKKQNPGSLQFVSSNGKIRLAIPKTAEYFRVLIWSREGGEPDLLTNWVDIVPNKSYTLKTDHLIPSVLMCGSGC